MERAEEILKQKLDVKIAILNNPNYTFNKVIEAMEQYKDEQTIKFVEWKERNYFHEMHELYRSNKEEHGLYSLTELLEIFKNQLINTKINGSK